MMNSPKFSNEQSNSSMMNSPKFSNEQSNSSMMNSPKFANEQSNSYFMIKSFTVLRWTASYSSMMNVPKNYVNRPTVLW